MGASGTLAGVAIATGCWLAIGGAGYSPWVKGDSGVIIPVMLLSFSGQFIGLTAAACSGGEAVYTIGAALGGTISILIVLLANTGCQNVSQGLFWVFSGIYFGLAAVGLIQLAHAIYRRRPRKRPTTRDESYQLC